MPTPKDSDGHTADGEHPRTPPPAPRPAPGHHRRHHRIAAALLGTALVVLTACTPSNPDLHDSVRSAVSGAAVPAAAAPPAWQLVSLGDSIPAGDGCDNCTDFVDLYAQAVARDTARPITVTDLGVGGWTSDDLVASLPEPNTTNAVSSANLLTVTIGANDFLPMLNTALERHCGPPNELGCFSPALNHLRENLNTILTRIQQLRRGLPTAVRVTGYWNVFLDGQVADTTYGPAFQQLSAALTRRVNSLIQQAAQAHAMTYIDLYTVFKGRAGTNDDTPLLAADGDHPSQAGDREIARALAAAGYAPVWNRN